MSKIEHFALQTLVGRLPLAGRLERPLAPVLVQATHHSIELEWEHVKSQDQQRARHRRLFDESGLAHSGSLIYLHQREKRSSAIWESLYTYVRATLSLSLSLSLTSNLPSEVQPWATEWRISRHTRSTSIGCSANRDWTANDRNGRRRSR